MSIPYWRLSGFYFFYFATVGTFLPYWSLYLKDSGFNPVQIGELFALLGGTRIIAPMLCGWIADHTGKHLRIIRITSFLTALLFAGFLYAKGYFWFAWITIAFGMFWNSTLPQFEAVTLYHLKDQAHRYSRIRLWGSIGFIVAVLGVGQLLDYQPLVIIPIAVTISMTLIWLVSLMTPAIQAPHHETAAVGIMQIMKSTELWAFLVVYLLLQLAHSPYYVFYSIYLKHYQYTASLTGFLVGAGCICRDCFIHLHAPCVEAFFPAGDFVDQYSVVGCSLVDNRLVRRLFLAAAVCSIITCRNIWRRACRRDSLGSFVFRRPASG